MSATTQLGRATEPATALLAAQTETVVSGTEVLVEAREQVCARGQVGSLIASRGPWRCSSKRS